MGTNGVGKEEVTTALGRGRMSGHVRGARPRMGPADGVHERGQWRVGHERGQWRAGHMSGANGGWRTNVFQLKGGVKSCLSPSAPEFEDIQRALVGYVRAGYM
uniref:Uncharacterized protein n=1 Tax=Globodera rostochiensis TaxID=31243 RepID=A0A914HQA2_GLORO